MAWKCRSLNIEDVKVLLPERFTDSRGFLFETYSERHFRELGIRHTWVQENQSHSAEAGIVRGLCFQIPPYAQAKLIRVVHGAMFDVVVDVRAGSPTYGQFASVHLSAVEANILYIPIGFAHGFCSLEPGTEMVYKQSAAFAPEFARGIAYDDPALGIQWPVPGQTLVSPRDAHWPVLSDFKSPFRYGGE